MTEEKHRKFDVIIGNPPFQDESIGNNSKAPSIYHLFMESSYKIGDVVELIHPARFLFNAGDTPKKWNRKMLNSNHIKVTYFTQNSINYKKGGLVKVKSYGTTRTWSLNELFIEGLNEDYKEE